MSSNGVKRIHHLRSVRDVGQSVVSGRARPGANWSSQANGSSSQGTVDVPRAGASTAITQAIVDLVRARTGRAPATAITEMSAALAIVTLGESLTVPEKTLAEKGRSALTIEVRNRLYQGMRAEAVAAVETATGRRVAAYLTDQQHDPDLAIIAFVFGPEVGPGAA